MERTIRIIGLLLSISIFIIGILCDNYSAMFIAVLVLFTIMLVYAYKQKENGLILFIFLIAFFTFLLGKYTLGLITGDNWGKDFSVEINMHIQLCLYISLIGIYVGFNFFNKKLKKKEENNKGLIYDIEKDENVKPIRKISIILFYLTLIFKIVVIFEKIFFVQKNSYISLYTEYSSNLPMIITKLSEINTFLMYIFFATFPNKKELKIPFIIFGITEILTILSGGRSKSVTTILFICVYLMYREFKERKNNNIKYKWIKKYYIKVGIILIPFFISFLGAYNYIRNDAKIENFSIMNQFVQFFDDQGGSVKIIGYVKKYEDQLPSTNSTYFFGPITSFYRNGLLGKLSGVSRYKGNSIEDALYGNNLGATISYIVLKNLYTQGLGLGTQYIAELYVDFKYIGIFVFNVFLGYLITKLNFRTDIKWYWSAILMSIIRLIIYIPRDFALSWFIAFFSITNWGTIFIVYILTKYVKIADNSKIILRRRYE